MKKTEFTPADQSTAFFADQANLNDIFRDILPEIFHKLKNKLTPIIGYSQILKSRTQDDFLIERLEKIENNATELTSLLNILKEYFKSEPMATLPGNINRIVRGLEPGWQKTATAVHVDLRFDLSPAVPKLPLHSGQIELLLHNLVANAMTALQLKTAPPKEISLATRLENGRVKLIIHDTGVGMEQTDLENIWVPFFAKFQDHAGLGLTICEKVLANHGATCRVRSSFGEFTEIEIDFPPPQKRQKKQTETDRQTDKK